MHATDWAQPTTYHSLLCELSEHDDHRAVILPDHPPEVDHCALQGPLSGDEGSLVVVALWATRGGARVSNRIGGGLS